MDIRIEVKFSFKTTFITFNTDAFDSNNVIPPLSLLL